MSNTEVLYAVLHDKIFVAGAGEHGPTLTKTLSGNSKGYKMTLEDKGVRIVLGARTFLIPTTNFKIIETNEA